MARPSKSKAAAAVPAPETVTEAAAPVTPDPASPQVPEPTGAEAALAATVAAPVEPTPEVAGTENPETPSDWIAPSPYPGSPDWFAQSQRRQRG